MKGRGIVTKGRSEGFIDECSCWNKDPDVILLGLSLWYNNQKDMLRSLYLFDFKLLREIPPTTLELQSLCID